MRLRTKLTLFNAISKLVIVVLFVLLVPVLINNISSNYVDSKLIKQKNKLLQIVKNRGIETYIENGEGYGSYLPLKEEFISLDEVAPGSFSDTIELGKRMFSEGDTLEYRILSHTFKVKNKTYLLEIGKSVDTLDETSVPLQNIAFQVLLGMILLTILADQFYSNYVLKPLRLIIKTKLVGQKFPNFSSYRKVRTTTTDFEYLDISIHKMVET
ncbi:MAG: sensor histidine kinase, partial [Mucilaginibacter sp.]